MFVSPNPTAKSQICSSTGLRKQGIESPQVFLVSSFESHLYDFSLLQQTLERDLPELLLAEHQPN